MFFDYIKPIYICQELSYINRQPNVLVYLIADYIDVNIDKYMIINLIFLAQTSNYLQF